jgi:iron only hydrogenase large subunit-like protein
VKFIEHFYPELLPHVSSCRAHSRCSVRPEVRVRDRERHRSEKIVSVALMPCTAKKFECQRAEMCASGYQDVGLRAHHA